MVIFPKNMVMCQFEVWIGLVAVFNANFLSKMIPDIFTITFYVLFEALKLIQFKFGLKEQIKALLKKLHH